MKNIKDILGSTLGVYNNTHHTFLSLFGIWEEVMGDLSSHVVIKNYKHNILEIGVYNPRLIIEIKFMKNDIVANIKKILPAFVITDIIVVFVHRKLEYKNDYYSIEKKIQRKIKPEDEMFIKEIFQQYSEDAITEHIKKLYDKQHE